MMQPQVMRLNTAGHVTLFKDLQLSAVEVKAQLTQGYKIARYISMNVIVMVELH